MNDYLSYFNINWNKYLHLFNIYENVQVIFLITKDEADNCLKIGNINNYDIYDVTYSKITILICLLFILNGLQYVKKIYQHCLIYLHI